MLLKHILQFGSDLITRFEGRLVYKRMDKRKTVVQFTGVYINCHKNDTLSMLDRHFGQECHYTFSKVIIFLVKRPF